MTTQPAVSIIVMVYRNADALKRTVDSILALSLKNVQVILSDDGSPEDLTEQLEAAAARLREKYGDVQVRTGRENVGTVKHFNELIGMAKGDYIVPCSSGDGFADADTLEHLIVRMERKGELILAARHRDIYPDYQKIRPSLAFGFMLNRMPKKTLRYLITKRNQISGCAVIYTKKLFEIYGRFDEDYRLLDDFPYYVMLLQKGVKIPYVHQLYTDHPMGGVSNTKVHPQILSDLRTMQRKLLAEPDGLDAATVAYLKKNVKGENDGN